MKTIFSPALLISFGLFFMLSCADSPSAKHSEEKEASVSDTVQAAVKQGSFPLNRKSVLSGKATMLLPGEFALMDAEMLALKYPQAGHRPTEVYTNEEGTINIALNYTPNRPRLFNEDAARLATVSPLISNKARFLIEPGFVIFYGMLFGF